MSILINRFKTKNLNKGQAVRFEDKGWVVITDLEKECPVAVVNVFCDYDKNTDLANRIIEVIEDEINGAEDQH